MLQNIINMLLFLKLFINYNIEMFFFHFLT
jgi:hypothetical protein